MQKQIKQYFKNPKNNLLIIKHTKKSNPVYEWPKIRNPLRLLYNRFILKIAKLFFYYPRSYIYRYLLGMDIGKNVAIASIINIDYFYPELISIGDNSIIGLYVKIFTHEFTHDVFRFGRVKIGKNVLIGADSVIRSGVIIGDNSIVSMNSFVNKNIPSNEMWGGIPAKRIKKI